MDKRLRIIGIVAALAASALILSSPSENLPIPEPSTSTSGSDSVKVIANNLEKPRSITSGDDRIFITEKIGRIRVIQNDVLLENSLATFRTADVFDGGLLGITTHPNFSENHFLYIFYTYVEDDSLWNKVVQIKEHNNKLEDSKTILDKIPGSSFSNGGIIKFGPDGKLYVATGSVSDNLHLSQSLDSLAGKILRLNDDGSIPDDNPFENSYVYSLGFRNPQGMAWNSSGELYVTDLGPTKNDEINLVLAGKNYGWPDQECSGHEEYVDAIKCYDPAIEPGGIVFYSGSDLPLENKMIMASLRAFHLFALDIDQDGLESQNSLLGGSGRLRDVYQDENGELYLLTSNTDGKGFPDDDDDKLMRIIK